MKASLTDEQYAALRRLLAEQAGLVFDEARKESMSYSIAERLRETGAPDVDAYLDLLSDAGERQRLVDEVTIQETHFFRNPPQVRALRQHVLPELLRHAEQHGRRLRIWSAGCSTGEEPYSVAMVLRELLPVTDGWDVKVLATDVSQRALAAARAGHYGSRAVMNATPEELARFFVSHQDGTHEVRAEVRSLVEFRHHNLVTEPVPFPSNERIDLVLCRNVTIYFSRDTTRELMKRLHACLRDGGYLFLGHSETLWQVSDDFRLVSLGSGEDAAFVYRRLDARPQPAPVRGSGERREVLPERRLAEVPPVVDRRAKPRRATDRLVELLSTPITRPSAKPKPRPVSADPQVAEARAALAAGRYDDAAAAAGRAMVVEPMRAEAFYLRGLALVDLGRDEDALVDLRKAAYLDPSMGFAHFLLAGVLDRLGDRAAAARSYSAAADTLGVAPESTTAPELGGRSVRELAQLCRQLEQRYHADRIEGVT